MNPKAILFALVAAAAAGAVQAQPVTRPVRPPVGVQPGVALHQPSNLDLQIQIGDLRSQIEELTSTVNALSAQLKTINASVAEAKQLDETHYKKLFTTEWATCEMLYQHVWAPGGVAHPTAQQPYVPQDYCEKALGQAVRY